MKATKNTETAAAAVYAINKEFDGIEISFPSIPAEAVRDQLKAAGYRWHKVRLVWYAKQTPERVALAKQICGAAEASEAVEQKAPAPVLTVEALEAIARKYSGLITADGSGIYAGYTGANGRGLYGQELKKAIIAELKKNGFAATARAGRCGWSDSFIFTIKVPAAFVASETDYIREETEDRAFVRGVYWYTSPAGESIHRDALPTNDAERRPILEETARRIYRDSAATQGGAGVSELFKAAVETIVTSFNADHSDSMTDYFDRAFYDDYKWEAAAAAD